MNILECGTESLNIDISLFITQNFFKFFKTVRGSSSRTMEIPNPKPRTLSKSSARSVDSHGGSDEESEDDDDIVIKRPSSGKRIGEVSSTSEQHRGTVDELLGKTESSKSQSFKGKTIHFVL